MKKKLKILFNYIRMTPVFRCVFYPYICYKTDLEIKKYSCSEDAIFLRQQKNRYEGKRCFIVGNGPSLTIEDLNTIRGEYSFASNGIVHLFDRTLWRPNWYMAVDKIIIEQMDKWDLSKLVNIEMFVYDKDFVRLNKNILDIHYFVRGGRYSIRPEKQVMESVSEDISNYFSRSQSIATSLIELALYLGFTDIVLIGFDHSFPVEIGKNGRKAVNKQSVHHFLGYKGKVRKVAYVDAITEAYECIRRYAENKGIRIVNCTRGGHLEVFERKTLEDVLGI